MLDIICNISTRAHTDQSLEYIIIMQIAFSQVRKFSLLGAEIKKKPEFTGMAYIYHQTLCTEIPMFV